MMLSFGNIHYQTTPISGDHLHSSSPLRHHPNITNYSPPPPAAAATSLPASAAAANKAEVAVVPRHVAVIMDGNVRWARKRGLVAAAGHEAGVRSLKELIRLCSECGVGALTVFAFSSDNWTRPKLEVDFLMSLFERVLRLELENFQREGIRVSTIGDTSRLPKSLVRLIGEVEAATTNNSRLHLIVAINYSGKRDMVQACRSIAEKVKNGTIQLEDVTDALVEEELETSCCEFPCPDLLIRTSGESRISNFLLWQLAYTELYFVETLWPDFGEAEFVEALASFRRRRRRYGGRDS